MMVFSLVTSLLIGAGCCVVVVAASSASDLVETLLDAIASVTFGVLAVIAAIFGAIFSLFGFYYPEFGGAQGTGPDTDAIGPSMSLHPLVMGHCSDSTVKQREGMRPRSRGIKRPSFA
jgi:hypothetical protein